VLTVELAMERLEPMEQHEVARVRPLLARWPLRRWGICLHGKFEKLLFCGPSKRARHPGVQKPNDGFQHAIRSEGVALVNAQDASAKAEHDRLVRVGDDLLDFPETECI
jgi:hypothetical protein